MTEKFKILDARTHSRERMGMYIGSSSLESFDRFINGKWGAYSYVPAIVKMVDEIIDNCVDEAIRTKFRKAKNIRISLEGDTVTVEDDGRGIPQDLITDTNGKKILRPVAAWTKTNAGTSFEDERTTIGANGLGSAIVNFCSVKFQGETWSGGKGIRVSSNKGITKEKDIETFEKQGCGTKVSFSPDFSLFDIDSLSEFNLEEIILDRLRSLSVSFPRVKFYFNDVEITTKIKPYSFSYLPKGHTATIISSNPTIDYFFCHSIDGFRSSSYVNGVNTRQGGSYVDYIVNNVVDKIIPLIKKKYKIDVTKALVKSSITFVLFVREFQNPKFDSQTKERLTNTAKEVSDHFKTYKGKEFEKIAKEILETQELIEPIVEAQLAKRLAAEKRAATLAQKKMKKVKVPKHIPANKKGGILFLCEGLSALGFGVDVRNPDVHGFYPMKGVPANTWNMTPSQVLKNTELFEVMSILGLNINEPESYKVGHYSKVGILSDSDVDGSHIGTLLIAFFHRFWPGMVEEGRLKIIRSPIMIFSKGKNTKWAFDYSEGKKMKEKYPKFSFRYIKGLASLTKQEYDTIINKPYEETVKIDEEEYLEIMFGDDAEKRKVWVTG